MIGEGSGIVPDRGMNVLARGTFNSLMNLTEADLTQDNYTIPSATSTRVSADTPKGLLAGSVVAVGESGTVVKATASDADVVGIVLNNAVGYPYESSSGVGSGKCVYLHGASSVFTTDLYETNVTWAAGNLVYSSDNGFLTNTGGAVVIGVVLIAPSATDPFMAVQMRI